MSETNTHRFCGRDFSTLELETIQQLIVDNPKANRSRLSRLVCQEFNWLKPDGLLKEMSCRVAMIRMQDKGLIKLPLPTQTNGNGKRYSRRTPEAKPPLFKIHSSVGKLDALHLELVVGNKASHLWNEYIDRYHYLGYQPLPGAQLRYFVRAKEQPLALLGFGAAAWKTAPRDDYIGWTKERRERNLNLIVDNARFLILPWVNSKNLASKILSMATRALPCDWQNRYGYRPVLAETFVEIPRFHGTCYKAANWIRLGETKGRGKLDVKHNAKLPTKSIWVYPLAKNFRRDLCQESSPLAL
jgi:hypothetical protein